MYRPQKHKNTVKLSVFFALFGSVEVKVESKMLVKFSPDETTTQQRINNSSSESNSCNDGPREEACPQNFLEV
jgi:hypothetical protein